MNSPNPLFDESLLTAYLDDELTAQEKRFVDESLASSPELRSLLNDLKRVRDLVISSKISIPEETRIVKNGPWTRANSNAATASSQDSRLVPLGGQSDLNSTTIASTETRKLSAKYWWGSLAALAASVAIVLSLTKPSSHPLRQEDEHSIAMQSSPRASDTYFDSDTTAQFGTEAYLKAAQNSADSFPSGGAFGAAPAVELRTAIAENTDNQLKSKFLDFLNTPSVSTNSLAMASPTGQQRPLDEGSALSSGRFQSMEQSNSNGLAQELADKNSGTSQYYFSESGFQTSQEKSESKRELASSQTFNAPVPPTMSKAPSLRSSADRVSKQAPMAANGLAPETKDAASETTIASDALVYSDAPALQRSSGQSTTIELVIPIANWEEAKARLANKGLQLPEDPSSISYFEATYDDANNRWTLIPSLKNDGAKLNASNLSDGSNVQGTGTRVIAIQLTNSVEKQDSSE